ncbi:MAG: hypothetical protein LBT36_05930 [Oscillospiraceae bacterium]|nr:hypothetical protein [Oscillospiraceae bacterium]
MYVITSPLFTSFTNAKYAAELAEQPVRHHVAERNALAQGDIFYVRGGARGRVP